MVSRPGVLFYCQHSVGMGHLVRSLALAEALARRCDVVLLSGGSFPPGMSVPTGVRLVELPPLGQDADFELVSRDPRRSLEEAQRLRVETVLGELRDGSPDVLLLELYPFGRRKFAFELLPLLEAAKSLARPPLVLCSIRDILVASRLKQARHDEQASQIANRFLDGVLVHADPRFARLEESFQPSTPLDVPVHYTGFVRRPAPTETRSPPEGTRLARVCVSAGGGLVGEPLFTAAAAAAPALYDELGLTTTVVTGPFLPESARTKLAGAATRMPDRLQVVGFVDDLAAEMAASAVSVSQCGYNTVMDLLSAGTPAVVVPYSEGREDEQSRRARRLEALGALTVLDAGRLSGATLAGAVRHALAAGPFAAPDLLLDGAARTVDLVESMLAAVPGASLSV